MEIELILVDLSGVTYTVEYYITREYGIIIHSVLDDFDNDCLSHISTKVLDEIIEKIEDL